MTSTMERAVEAGARAFEDVSVWPAKTYRERAMSAAIRAAFPILAEDLVAWHDGNARAAKRDAAEARSVIVSQQWGRVAKWHQEAATALRARIQQMTEAL